MADTNSPDTAETAPSSDERDLVAAGTADDAIEADILRRACEEAGIEVLVSEARGGMVEKLSSPSASFFLIAAKHCGCVARFTANCSYSAVLEVISSGMSRASSRLAAMRLENVSPTRVRIGSPVHSASLAVAPAL